MLGGTVVYGFLNAGVCTGALKPLNLNLDLRPQVSRVLKSHTGLERRAPFEAEINHQDSTTQITWLELELWQLRPDVRLMLTWRMYDN